MRFFQAFWRAFWTSYERSYLEAQIRYREKQRHEREEAEIILWQAMQKYGLTKKDKTPQAGRES